MRSIVEAARRAGWRPTHCQDCGFAIPSGKRLCPECREERAKQRKLTAQYEKGAHDATKRND